MRTNNRNGQSAANNGYDDDHDQKYMSQNEYTHFMYCIEIYWTF